MIQVNHVTNIGILKPMNAVNNGPYGEKGRHGNYDLFKELKIPYIRNHDASLTEEYGSQHLVDVHCIFTDFSRSPDNECAYDFTLTDIYMQNALDMGAEVFYRLGSSIEHWAKKYGTVMPSDFLKWAKVCEHIILHYNEGWANGYKMDIKYWEIWNEPDLDEDDSLNKRTWGGTKLNFFEFYHVVATYLKNKFPKIKIGGPALAYREDWAEEFLHQLKAPLDFFSWHIYSISPEDMVAKAVRIRNMLDKYSFTETESILDEYNYMEGWHKVPFRNSISVIKGLKGAAYTIAVFCSCQNSNIVDMLMYYDARVRKEYNGLFDSDYLEPLKTYYAFMAYSEIYSCDNQIDCISDEENIYALAAIKDNLIRMIISAYNMDATKEINIELSKAGRYQVYIIDNTRNLEKIFELHGNAFTITINPNEILFIKEI